MGAVCIYIYVHHTQACQGVGRRPNHQDAARVPRRAQRRRVSTEPLRTGALAGAPLLRQCVSWGLSSPRHAGVYDASQVSGCMLSLSELCWVALQTRRGGLTARTVRSLLWWSPHTLTSRIANCAELWQFLRSVLAVARKQATSQEILLWMTPSEAPKALQASECSELLDPMRASCWISAQH